MTQELKMSRSEWEEVKHQERLAFVAERQTWSQEKRERHRKKQIEDRFKS